VNNNELFIKEQNSQNADRQNILSYLICIKECGSKEGIDVSDGQRVLLYILSFLIPIVGIILGIIWLNDQDPGKKAIGKNCLVFGIISIVLSCICWFALTALSITPAFMTS
jgi:hypothetical protein